MPRILKIKSAALSAVAVASWKHFTPGDMDGSQTRRLLIRQAQILVSRAMLPALWLWAPEIISHGGILRSSSLYIRQTASNSSMKKLYRIFRGAFADACTAFSLNRWDNASRMSSAAST